MKNVLILSSGNGSNFEAIINFFKNDKHINFKLLCNNKTAYVIKRAEKLKIKTIIIENTEKINNYLINNKFDLVVLAGFLKILSKQAVENNTTINIHPSLLPKYKGLNAIAKAYKNKESKSGITIHYVDEKLDHGKTIYQKDIKIKSDWDETKLESKIHELEHFYYPRIIKKLLGINAAVVGSGAREHTIASKISQSEFLDKLYLVDPNDGFSSLGQKIKYNNYNDLAEKLKNKNIDIVIIGSENYLDSGLVDILNKYRISTIGPDKKTAKLESSKLYAKKLMKKYNITTSPYKKITDAKNIDKFLKSFNNPIIKADGLAAGKGVYYNSNIDNLKIELKNFLNGKYGTSSAVTIIEEKLEGFEASLFSFFDGQNLLHFPLCQDYKKNEKGLNTGGLGSICPLVINKKEKTLLNVYKNKLKNMLLNEKITAPFVVYSGLMFTKDGLYILEYNVRLGDPETQSLMNYIKNDWLDIFYSCANKMLNNIKLKFNTSQYCVVVASKGYPEKIKKGIKISNIDPNITTYFANITKKNECYYSNGGRVLSFVSNEKKEIYEAIKKLNFSEKSYKKDI